ncbi:hypothetical protein CK203_017421 [Vitis vinifera]|uniref:Uncharacterized protein n=1 Tax=Vitis vinifera TaxID=29760 RepID=A0A438IXY8_VITVI|nr:hypothetical protein CK203_017421 [Vitis vinifera]
MAAKKTVSSSRASEVRGKAIDKLDAKEFRERFCIPNGVAIELLNGRVLVPSEKAEEKTIIFSKEQFNVGLRFPLPVLFKEFLHFTQIPPVFIHPNIVRVLMGCSIINMLYNLDLTLLEVFFVYSLKKVKNDIFSMSAHLPSLQLVTELPDSTKGGATGHVVVRGAWAGLLEHPARPFSPNYSLVVPGRSGIEGPPCGLGGKGVFCCLSKLFEIDAKERQCKTLLTARNLTAVVREPQEYVINILPRKMPKEVVPGEHYIVKDLPIYEALKEADAEKRRLLLEDREKKKNEGTLRKAPGQKRTQTLLQRKLQKGGSCGSGHLAGLNHSSTSLAAVARLANLAEEAASVNHPDSRNPDADAAEAVCATPWRKGAESQSQPSDDPDRLALVLVTGPPQRSLARYAELEDKLKQIPPGSPDIMPQPRCSRCGNAAPELEEAEASLSTIRKENEALRVDLAEAKAGGINGDRLHEAADEMAPEGGGEATPDRSFYEKKQREDLQLRLVAQKEELEREFAAEREELEAEYQKQVMIRSSLGIGAA